ncbi:Alpha-N-acetylgalactosaminide alpha-2,6-sialyltransferase 2 [Takifugu flavidus]|uniref:alpha-N-acetylgalactosaminide alpha-2,6-sialyltransferase n=1 Tax=Takifugu flavidus TaxID=433684 RepID=A0A5C6PQG9_9TELE|nr:Alpha-N-acetylgalactosaminide alpha-2,6-sialyltransferase 2 [Takifugu flavidus]
MALQTKLVLATLTMNVLMWVYILCMSWQTFCVTPRQTVSIQRDSSGSLESMKLSDQQIKVDSRTTATPAYVKSSGPRQRTEHRAREQEVQNVSRSTPRSRGANQTRIEVPVKKKITSCVMPGIWDMAIHLEDIVVHGANATMRMKCLYKVFTALTGHDFTLKCMFALISSTCPDGIRTLRANTEFSGNFLNNVPVLQWARHATHEEYGRLSQHRGAHGWGGVDYNTLVDALSVLNSSANWQMLDDWKDRRNNSECIRCAVVGNGGILKDSKRGTEIDSHHYVFRTNGAVIKGFEKDVGSRTTHYTFSATTLMNSIRVYAGVGFKAPPVAKETRYIFLPENDRDYLLVKAAATHTLVERGPQRNQNPASFFGKDVSAEKVKMYHPDFVRYLRNRFLRSATLKTKYKDIYRPSTGAVMLLAALHTCDKVSAYGFMTPDYMKYSDHYYDKKQKSVVFFKNHDLRMEMALWQRLHQAGLIQLYMHQ